MQLDVDDVGFADVNSYSRIDGGCVPNEIWPKAKTAVVYVTLLERVLKKYGHWYAVSLVNHISKTNKQIVNFLSKIGYTGRGIGENEYSRSRLIGRISFRQMAVLAGLGSVGKSRMLIHPIFGPRVVIGVVLTNANIEVSKPHIKRLCTDCDICVKLCPVRAIDEKFDKWKCKQRRKILKMGCEIPCVRLCPIGAPE